MTIEIDCRGTMAARWIYYLISVALIFAGLWGALFLALIGIWGGTQFLEEVDALTLTVATLMLLFFAFMMREFARSRSQ